MSNNVSRYFRREEIEKLCGEIEIPPEVTERVMRLIDGGNLDAFSPYVNNLLKKDSAKEAAASIERLCADEAGHQEDNGIKTMSVFLIAALRNREIYCAKGIPDRIFLDTMGFFRRVLAEYHAVKKRYGFDRGSWFHRQISRTIFRLGALEFEMRELGDGEEDEFQAEKNERILSVHIPSDALMTREALDESYRLAHSFFPAFYPEFEFSRVFCSTWLLYPPIKELLPPDSRILNFQSDYIITRVTENNDEYMFWVYKTKEKVEDYNKLPEDTSLMRAIKKRLLAGSHMGSAAGYVINSGAAPGTGGTVGAAGAAGAADAPGAGGTVGAVGAAGAADAPGAVGACGAAAGTLYVVATPIGNIEDISDRAKRVLSDAALIAAEDTRSANALLKSLNIKNRTVSNHKFNERFRETHLLSELEHGADVAVVSDAGTPCISDPGGIIVRAAADRGVHITPVCGASAVTAALSVCGFRFDAFSFYGFLPRTAKGIENIIKSIYRGFIDIANVSKLTSVAVFYESPKRIKKTMAVFASKIPDASICLCNDLTKKYERIYRGRPQHVLDELTANPSAEKGEYTLVVSQAENGGYTNVVSQAEQFVERFAEQFAEPVAAGLSAEATLIDYIVKQGGSLKDAVARLSGKTGYTKNQLYAASINLKRLFEK